jgi:hypothetical protein
MLDLIVKRSLTVINGNDENIGQLDQGTYQFFNGQWVKTSDDVDL